MQHIIRPHIFTAEKASCRIGTQIAFEARGIFGHMDI